MHKRRFLSALGAAFLGAAGARAGVARVCHRGLFRRWQFHGGAPLSSGAVVSASGRVAVATHEGYLHALAPDGAFLWSYTVDGALLTGVHLAAKNRFVAATSTGKIYSLWASGRPHWVFTAPAVPELVGVDPGRGVLLFTKGRGLYAVSSRAGLLWSMNLGAEPSSNLRVDPEGRGWVVTSDGTLHRIKTPYFSEKLTLKVDLPQPNIVGFCKGGALIQAAHRLVCVDDQGAVRWEREDVVTAAPVRGGKQVAVLLGGAVEWIDAISARRSSHLVWPSAVPEARWTGLCAVDDWAFCTSSDGQLAVLTRAGRASYCRLGNAPLFAPTYDAKRSQVIVSAGSGEVSAVSLLEWS